MKEIGNSSDRGKEEATVAIEKKDDILRSQYAEKLKFDPQRNIMKGGSSSEESTSEYYSRIAGQMNRSKENMGESWQDSRQDNIRRAAEKKKEAEEKKREEQYNKYQEKRGVTYYR